MSVCIGGAVRGGVGPGGKGPATDDSAAILTIKENKPTTKMKTDIHAIPYIRFPMPLISGF
jgi:hypothetical protein